MMYCSNNEYDSSSSSIGSSSYSSKEESSGNSSSQVTTSSSEITYFATDHENTENGNITGKKMKEFFSKKKVIVIGMFILLHVMLIFINIIIIIFFTKSRNNVKETNENEMKQYQLIYRNKIDNEMKDEVIKIDMEFEGDFYPFEDEFGNGIMVKLDSEGDQYEMCADECRCYVECNSNTDCGNGLCVDHQCLGNERRKGTRSGRKVAQVLFTVPLLFCSFGFFTSMRLAQEYGDKYFNEKCEESCPVHSDEIDVDVDVDIGNGNKKIRRCFGNCEFNRKKFTYQVQKRIKENSMKFKDSGYSELYKNIDFNDEISTKLLEENSIEAEIQCKKITVDYEFISNNEREAELIFTAAGLAACDSSHFMWKHDIKLGNGERVFSAIHELGVLDHGACKLNKETVKCQ